MSPNTEAPQEPAPLASSCGSFARWYDILPKLQTSTLQGNTPACSQYVASLLQQALLSVRQDEQWSCSGIAELLQRALEMAERGSAQSAIKAGVDLLDFHKMVQKYRTVAPARSKSTSSGSEEAGQAALSDSRSASPEAQSTDRDVLTSEPAAKRAKLHSSDSPTSSIESDVSQDSSDNNRCLQDTADKHQFAVPPPKVGSTKPVLHTQASSTLKPPTFTWSGTVRQRVKSTEVELCSIEIQVPVAHAPCLVQPHLLVEEVAPRKGIKLGKHEVCRTSITKASSNQITKLKTMAINETVGFIALPDRRVLVLVPYLDNKQELKIVCFLFGGHK